MERHKKILFALFCFEKVGEVPYLSTHSWHFRFYKELKNVNEEDFDFSSLKIGLDLLQKTELTSEELNVLLDCLQKGKDFISSRTVKCFEEPGFLGWSEGRYFSEIGHKILTNSNVSKKQFEKCFDILGMVGESAIYVLNGCYSDDVDFVCYMLDKYADLRTWVGDYHDGVGEALLYVCNLDKETIESIMEREDDVIPEEINTYKVICPYPVLLSVLNSLEKPLPKEDMEYFTYLHDHVSAPLNMILSCVEDEELVRKIGAQYLHRRYLTDQKTILEGIARNPVFKDYTWEMHQEFFESEDKEISQRSLSKVIEKIFCSKFKK